MSIGRNAPRPAAADVPALQWANGKTVYRETIGAGRFTSLVGFHIEAGKDAELDRCLHDVGVTPIEIKHQRDGGSEIVRHWFIGEMVDFHPVTAGPPYETMAGCVRAAEETAAAGLGVRWRDGERSKLAVRGYVRSIVEAGYAGPVQLSTRSRMTDELLACLRDHYRVCEIADSLVDRTKHPAVVDLHEIALPLQPGDEAEWGKGDTATVVPFRSAHPERVDGAYLRTVWRPDSIHAAALADWPAIVAWARDYATEEAA